MKPPFNSQQLILLFGGGVLVISVLLLVVYFLQQSVGRARKSGNPKPARVPVEDEAAFTLATVNAVITQLKAEQKSTQEKFIAAERRAEENARKFELLAREIDFGLMVLDAEGFIGFSNLLARRILGVDTWSRRRYGEIFRDIPDLALIIGDCFEAGMETRKRSIELSGTDGSKRWVDVSVLPSRDRSGAMDVVACVVRESAPPAPDT
ncbi:MAG: hypothetical protein ACLQVL_19680 [Terriglobia bacterium]